MVLIKSSRTKLIDLCLVVISIIEISSFLAKLSISHVLFLVVRIIDLQVLHCYIFLMVVPFIILKCLLLSLVISLSNIV
jgi:hypothetical protein